MNREEKIITERASLTSMDFTEVKKTNEFQKGTALEKKGAYNEMVTPSDQVEDIEGGALRAGGAPNLYSRDNIGLVAQYAAIGLVYGSLPKTVYPIFNNYLGMEGYQTTAVGVIMSLPWSFKCFIGIVTDSFPIMGYKRRPYMIIGWIMCLLCLIGVAVMPLGKARFDNLCLGEDDKPPTPQFPYSKKTCPLELQNLKAPDTGGPLLILMMFASIGYVIADVAADGMVVEFAQREPENVRGNTQTTIYLTRTVFSIFSNILIAFGFNSIEYGGSFDFSLSIGDLMWILVCCCGCIIPFTIFFLTEEKSVPESFIGRVKQMWTILQRRVIWQIMAQKFFSGVFWGFGATPAMPIQYYWAKVEPLNENIFGIVGLAIMAGTLAICKKWGLNWDWRITIGITTVMIIVIDSIVSFITIFDVFRSQWFWLGVPILEELPYGIKFIISTFIVVEIADEGYEAMTYGLITTISNLSGPFAAAIYKNVDSFFDVSSERMIVDDNHVRMQVCWTFIIMYIMKTLSLGWLAILPKQKKEAQELKKYGGSNRTAGIVAIAMFAFALLWATMTNIMSVFPNTKCLRIAGGQGC